MSRRISFLLAGIAFLIVCSRQHATAGEVVLGRVRVVYSNAGDIGVFYGDVEVARKFSMFCRNMMRRDTRVGFEFPLGGPAGTAPPKVEKLAGKAGEHAGSVITWDLNQSKHPNDALDPAREHFVRVTVSGTRVKVHFSARAEPYASMKPSGTLSFCAPKKAFEGGSYSGIGYPKPDKITRDFPPPDHKYPQGERFPGLRGCNSRNGCTFQTAPGPQQFRMAIEPSYSKISFFDGSDSGSGDMKDMWIISTGIKWHVDQWITLEFKPPEAAEEHYGFAPGYWKFDEGGLEDALGNHPRWSVGKSTTWVGGRFGKALRIAGDLSYESAVIKRREVKLNPGSPPPSLSVSVWFKLGKSEQNRVVGIVSTYGHKEPKRGFNLFVKQDRLSSNMGNSGELLWSRDVVSDDKWHHAVIAFAGKTDIATMWVDGVQCGSKKAAFLPSLSDIRLGAYYSPPAGGKLYNGLIDELRIFDKALSEKEAQALFTGAGK